MSEYPKIEYPTIVEGTIRSDRLRLECIDGEELEISKETINLYPNFLAENFPGITFDGENFHLKNAGPFNYGSRTYGITHLQKYSTWGWLKVIPGCFHRWWFWGLQKKNSDGNWLPGTERGMYFRKPFSWRWDVAGTMIDGKLQHWIWTKGYLGGHWD